MITAEKVKVYIKYRDIDFFARIGTNSEKKVLTTNDWEVIETLIQNSHLVEKRLASASFTKAAAKYAASMATAGAMEAIHTFVLNTE